MRFCTYCAYDFAQPVAGIALAPTVMQSRACPRCGAISGADAHFCQICAAPLDQSATSASVAYMGGAVFSRSRWKPFIIGGAIFAVALVALAIVFFVWKSNTPAAVAKKFVLAYAKYDRATMKGLLSKAFLESSGMNLDVDMTEAERATRIKEIGGLTLFEVTNEEITGDQAVVECNVKFGERPMEKVSMDMIREDGGWKISGLK